MVQRFFSLLSASRRRRRGGARGRRRTCGGDQRAGDPPREARRRGRTRVDRTNACHRARLAANSACFATSVGSKAQSGLIVLKK